MKIGKVDYHFSVYGVFLTMSLVFLCALSIWMVAWLLIEPYSFKLTFGYCAIFVLMGLSFLLGTFYERFRRFRE